MEEAARKWITAKVARGEIGTDTARVTLSRLTKLIEINQGRPVGDLDRDVILEYMAEIGSFRASTRRQYVSTVKLFTRWLVDEAYLETDPCSRLPKVRDVRRAPRALAPEEVAALLSVASVEARWYAVVWLMVGCGLRCIEVSRLDLRDWERTANRITVRGKGGHERTLPLPTPVRLALESYLDTERGLQAGPLILPLRGRVTPDGRISSPWLSAKVGRMCTEAGFHSFGDGRTAHALRHTCASDVLERCHDVRLVQELLGHQSLATTQIYLRRAKLDDMREAMEGRDYAAVPPLRAVRSVIAGLLLAVAPVQPMVVHGRRRAAAACACVPLMATAALGGAAGAGTLLPGPGHPAEGAPTVILPLPAGGGGHTSLFGGVDIDRARGPEGGRYTPLSALSGR